jgi:transposase
MTPVVPPKSDRLHPWDYDRALYKRRNEIERLFRRLKRLSHALKNWTPCSWLSSASR